MAKARLREPFYNCLQAGPQFVWLSINATVECSKDVAKSKSTNKILAAAEQRVQNTEYEYEYEYNNNRQQGNKIDGDLTIVEQTSGQDLAAS